MPFDNTAPNHIDRRSRLRVTRPSETADFTAFFNYLEAVGHEDGPIEERLVQCERIYANWKTKIRCSAMLEANGFAPLPDESFIIEGFSLSPTTIQAMIAQADVSRPPADIDTASDAPGAD